MKKEDKRILVAIKAEGKESAVVLNGNIIAMFSSYEEYVAYASKNDLTGYKTYSC